MYLLLIHIDMKLSQTVAKVVYLLVFW